MHTFQEATAVHGITLLNNELYTIHQRDVDDQLQVYSTSDFRLLRRVTVPDLRGKVVEDMTSCEQKQCIYASDNANGCVYQVVLDRSVSRWPVKGRPQGLSVTRDSNLLVTCCDTLGAHGKLLLLRSDSGECLEEIVLDPDILCPWHAVQLSDRQCIVCHEHDGGGLSRVGADGKVVGGRNGCGGLSRPRHMAVNNDQSLLVADEENNQIVLFDSSLNYVFSVMQQMRSKPRHLCYDDVARRLYVGQDDGVVSVVQL